MFLFICIVKNILTYFKAFREDSFRWPSFLLILLFNAILVYANWGLGLFSWIRHTYGAQPEVVFVYWILFVFVFLTPFIIQSFFSQDFTHFRKGFFYFFILFSTFIFSLRFSYYHFNGWLSFFYGESLHKIFWARIANSIFRLMLVVVPIFLFWILFELKKQAFYGCTTKNFTLTPYFFMLLFMLPLIFLASTQSDFLGAYPRAKYLYIYQIQNPEHWKYFTVYELFYGLDFFSIELFFRGFLLLGAIRILGPNAILSAATFYVVIHFGKPMGEAISSFFGGTILGVITFYGKSIWGGFIVHVGIAWMMEFGAFLSTWLKQ